MDWITTKMLFDCSYLIWMHQQFHLRIHFASLPIFSLLRYILWRWRVECYISLLLLPLKESSKKCSSLLVQIYRAPLPVYCPLKSFHLQLPWSRSKWLMEIPEQSNAKLFRNSSSPILHNYLWWSYSFYRRRGTLVRQRAGKWDTWSPRESWLCRGFWKVWGNGGYLYYMGVWRLHSERTLKPWQHKKLCRLLRNRGEF